MLLLVVVVMVVVVMVAILVLDLLLGAHHHVQQVAEEEVGGRQGLHSGLGDAHLLVAGGAPQLQRVPGAALALEALPAEGVEAGQDVEPPGGLAGGGGGVRGRRRGRGAGGNGSGGAAQLLAERAGLQVRVREGSHLHRHTGSAYSGRSDVVEVSIGARIGPLSRVENKVGFEVDS